MVHVVFELIVLRKAAGEEDQDQMHDQMRAARKKFSPQEVASLHGHQIIYCSRSYIHHQILFLYVLAAGR